LPSRQLQRNLERGRTGTGLGRGIEVGDCVQPPLARLPGAEHEQLEYYNYKRRHSALDYRRPYEVVLAAITGEDTLPEL
jgi:hypothetical protein